MRENRTCNVGYVTHAFDKIWKPIASREEFLEVLEQPVVRNTISMIRSTASKADKQKLKQKLPAFFFMGRTADSLPGSRVKGNLVPTGLAMIDVDDIENPEEIYERFKENGEFRLLLSHRTPSGHGVRFVVAKPDAVSIEEVQARVAQMLDVKLDTACKDISRLSYACLPEDVFFLDEEMFFINDNDDDNDNGTAYKNEDRTAYDDEDENKNENEDGSFPEEYEGVSYKKIVESLTDQMGGAPAHGSRNQFIFAMACLLRHICNDDPDWIIQVIPTFGESRDKVRSSVMSACNRNQTSTMPRTLQKAINLAKMDRTKDDEEATPPEMPLDLPPLIFNITQNVPDYIVPTLSQMCFPALGALVSKTCFRYIDNVLHEPSLMQVQIGKTAAGKGYVDEPLRIITQDIENEDSVGRAEEEEWRKQCSQLGANKKKPARPEVVIRMISSNMTNAIFVQRILDTHRAEQKYMFSQFNEIEMLDDFAKGSSAGGRKEVSKIIRYAYDNSCYGQERFGAQAVSGKAPIRWNWVASTTVQNGKKYFSGDMLSNGTMNRVGFSYIEPQPRGEVPMTGIYEDEYEASLRPYLDNLQRQLEPTHQYDDVIKKVCVGRDKLGREIWQYRIADTTKPFIIEHKDGRKEVFCPEAYKLAVDLNKENVDTVILSGDETYDSFTLRANVIAYKKAMLLYLANGCVWDQRFEDFIRWSEQYDLWCKMQMFGEAAKENLSNETLVSNKRGPSNMLTELPKHFTREDLIALRRKKGMSGNPKSQLGTWKHCGYIISCGDGSFKVVAPGF